MKKFITSVFAAMLLLAISAEATPLYTKCAACHGEKGEKFLLVKASSSKIWIKMLSSLP